MATTARNTDLSRFCSICAQEAGVDPAGSAYSYKHVVLAEIPLPWPSNMYSLPDVLPPEIIKIRERIIEAYQQGLALRVAAFAIAPDPAYSKPGYRRLLSYKRPEGPSTQFIPEEYLVPEDLLGPLAYTILIEQEAGDLSRFAEYRLPQSNARDLLVCTQGSVDAACAKFGFPLYRQLRQIADESEGRLRAWRVSHFGGHIFAPTLIDMPEFRYWAYVNPEEAVMLSSKQGDVSRLRRHYRGWGGFESPLLQVAERELFLLHGWEWLEYPKTGRILEQAEVPADDHHADPAWALVEISYTSPDGATTGVYHIRVEQDGHIETPHTSGNPATYPYVQYRVTDLQAQ